MGRYFLKAYGTFPPKPIDNSYLLVQNTNITVKIMSKKHTIMIN